MFTLYLSQLRHILGFISLLIHIYYILHFPYIISVSILYSSGGSLMFSSFSLYCFLKDILLISYGHQIYIIVDIVLYLYTLPINHHHHSFSSLCLSCNLSQAQDYNNMKLKKYEIKNMAYNFQYIGKDMETNITTRQQKQDYYMLKR